MNSPPYAYTICKGNLIVCCAQRTRIRTTLFGMIISSITSVTI